MSLKVADEKNLRKYLLGVLQTDEQEALEQWLLSEEDAYDLLVAAEDDLIDDSIAGKLTVQESDRFHNYFLASPERQRKLRFGRGFQRSLRRTAVQGVGNAQSPSIAETLGALFRFRPVFGSIAAALIVVIAAGGVWSISRTAQLQRQLLSADIQISEIEKQREALQGQLAESRAAGERLSSQVENLERTVTDVKSSTAPEAVLALNLLPILTRSSGSVPKAVLTTNTRLIRFSLALLDGGYSTYRAALLDDGGQEILHRERLTATSTPDGMAVVLTVPASALSNGDYSFRLSGISDNNPPEGIGNYPFQAVQRN